MNRLATICMLALLVLISNGCAHRRACGGYAIGPSMVVRSELLDVAGCDVPPIPHSLPESVIMYPFEMERAAATGRVELEADISETGVIEDIRVTWSTHEQFSDAVRGGVSRVRFVPAKKDGVPVRCTATYTIRFINQDEEVRKKAAEPGATDNPDDAQQI